MQFLVLGPLVVVSDGEAHAPRGAKERAVLARLLADAGRPVAVDALLDAVWDDVPRDAAARSLSVRIARLRALLEPDRDDGAPPAVLVRDGPGYRLAVEPEQVDATRFERAVRAAHDAAPAVALEQLDAALALWRGSPFPELTGGAAGGDVLGEVRRLEQLRRHAVERRAAALVALGRFDEAVAVLEALVADEPLREEVVRALMLARYRAGRQVEALDAYRALAERLVALGLRPVQETRELEQRILDQDPSLADPVAAGGPVTASAAGALAGRRGELAALDAALEAAIAGHRQVALLGGEAGVGKTAVVEAFLARAAARERVTAAVGQCVEHRGSGEPYLPVLDALGALTRGDAGSEARAVLARHAPTWLVQLPWLVDDADAETLERRVRGANRERMLRELLEAIAALADRRPLVLVLEDLHWADGPTLDLLAALARRRGGERLLVVGTFRPATPGAGSPPVQAIATELCLRGACQEIAVGRLPAGDVRALVAARFPAGAPAEVVDALVRRTGGNALFCRLLLDHWLAAGAIADDAGAARLAVPVADLEAGLPLTLRAHLEDRLAELDPADAELLQAAAVAGPRVAAATVAAAAGRPVAEVADRLAVLAHATPLLERRDGELAFAHDLEREVFADTVPAERRSAWHARIGAHLEALHGAGAAEHAAELAYHAVAGGQAERALHFQRLAAQRAFGRHAHAEGVRHLRGALDAAAALPEGAERLRAEVELLSELGQAIVAVDGWSSPAAEGALLAARERAARLDDNEPLVSVLLALATLCELRGELSRAHAITQECLRRAPVDDDTVQLEFEELLACNLFHQGLFTRALEHADAGTALFERLGPDAGGYSSFPAALGENAGVACQDWAGLALWFLGRPDEALKRARLALELAADPRRAYSRATATAQLAFVHACRREPEPALRWAQATIDAARELGYAYRVAMGRAVRGWAVATLGDPETGIAEIAGGLARSRATGARMDDPQYLSMLAEAQLLAGDPEAADAAIDEGIALGGRERSRYAEPELLRLRAAATGDAGRAEQALRAAVALAHEQGARMLELRARTDLVTLVADRPAVAARERATLAALLTLVTEGGDTPDLRAAHAAVAGAATVDAP